MLRQDLDENASKTMRQMVYGNEDSPWMAKVNARETAQEFCYPPIGAVITGAARLILAILECLVTDAGGTWLFCDTDSMAIVSAPTERLIACPGGQHRLADGSEAIKAMSFSEVDRIRLTMNRLNPYDRTKVPDILKNETAETNAGDQVYGYGVSAKRYTLYTYADGKPVVPEKIDGKRAYSEHGLGLYLPPTGDNDWMRQTWQHIVDEAHGLKPEYPEWCRYPALIRSAISSPHVMRSLRKFNHGKTYRDLVKPFGFVLMATTFTFRPGQLIWKKAARLISPYSRNPDDWLHQKWQNLENHKTAAVKLEHKNVKTMLNVVKEYRHSPESKSEGTTGVMTRRTIGVLSIIHTGKESNKLDDNGVSIFTWKPGQRITDYPSAEASTNKDGKAVNLHIIRQAFCDMTAKQIAEAACLLSLNETARLVTYKIKPDEWVQKWERVWDEKLGKEVFQELKAISVSQRTVERFMAGQHVSSEVTSLLERLAATKIGLFAHSTERATPGVILASWNQTPYRMMVIQERTDKAA
jgi:hypothetical protein